MRQQREAQPQGQEEREERPHERIHLPEEPKRNTDPVVLEPAGGGGDCPVCSRQRLRHPVPSVVASPVRDHRMCGDDGPHGGKYDPQAAHPVGPVFLRETGIRRCMMMDLAVSGGARW